MWDFRGPHMAYREWLVIANRIATGESLQDYEAERSQWIDLRESFERAGFRDEGSINAANRVFQDRQNDWQRAAQVQAQVNVINPLTRAIRRQILNGEDLWELAGVPGEEMTIQKKPKEPRKPFFENTLETAFPGVLRFGAKCNEIGLEIECEGENLFREPISFWSAVIDQSLRPVNGSQPLEYVLKKPLERDQLKKALLYLNSGLKGARLVWSNRTSVHVHVNCRDLTMMNIINYICLYWAVEGLLTEWSGPDRKGNLFCLRAQDAEWQVDALAKACRSFNFGNVMSANYRYAACNISSLQNHGSLEFRTMKGTTDTQRILDWVEILTALKDRAQDFKNPAEIGDLFMKIGPADFVKNVFDKRVRPETLDWMLNTRNTVELVNTSFHVAKDAMYATDWNELPKVDSGSLRPVNSRYRDDEEDY